MTYLLLAASCHGTSLVLASIDLEKAYDRLPRLTLCCVLAEELEVPVDIRTGIEALYYQTRSVVQGGGGFSAAFDVNIGVKEGCPASPRVFYLFFDRVRDFIAAHTPYLALLATFILLYTDDVALIVASPERLQQILHAFGRFADMHGMRIS